MRVVCKYCIEILLYSPADVREAYCALPKTRNLPFPTITRRGENGVRMPINAQRERERENEKKFFEKEIRLLHIHHSDFIKFYFFFF